MKRLVCALGAAALGAAAALAVATPAAAACAEPGFQARQVPWPQLALAPERAWPLSRGWGVTVAVLDSGVDANHPQLRGRVLAGYDALAGKGAANTDCRGTGTQVAGVIAARPANDAGFSGIAPNATILPIRVVDDTTTAGVADPAVLAAGIDAAVAGEADVIAISVVTYLQDDRLAASVDAAARRGIVVVAAVGDRGDAAAGNPTAYPAAYPNVIGVGAIDRAGARWSRSQHGGYVDLMAPGVEVLTLQSGGGMVVVDGTGVACGFVAATAALVRARRGASVSGSEVRDVLVGTAVPAAAGRYYGRGIIDPYAAVSQRIRTVDPAPLPALERPHESTDPAWLRSRSAALAGAGIALLVAVAVIAGAFAWPRGRRRFWRGTLAPRTTAPSEPEDPGPPIVLFDDRVPHSAPGGPQDHRV